MTQAELHDRRLQPNRYNNVCRPSTNLCAYATAIERSSLCNRQARRLPRLPLTIFQQAVMLRTLERSSKTTLFWRRLALDIIDHLGLMPGTDAWDAAVRRT